MMRIFGIVFILLSVHSGIFSQQPVFEWASQCGNPPNSTDAGTALSCNQDGNFFLSGEFQDTAQFGNKVLVASGGTDIFLVKYHPEGTPIWTNKLGGADDDYVGKTISDNEGNVIVAGYFYGTTQIGTDQYTSFGSQDIFIAKYNPDGDFVWSYRAGGPMADYISDLSMDADQNIVITGYFYDVVSFGDTTVYTVSGSDVYIAKFSPGGDMLWVTTAGGSSSDQARSVSCDPAGNILASGSFYEDITLGDTLLTTSDPVGVFIAKYFPDGQLDEAFQLNGTYLTPEVYVKACQAGDFYISGNFSGQVTFGNKTFVAGEFNQDIFTAKYDPTCKLRWAKHAFSYAGDQVVGIETDASDNLYLTGHYLDSIHFDLLALPYTLCCGSREIFIVSYSADGDVLWGEQMSGTRASIQSLDMNQQNELLLSGLFTEDLVLGPLKLSNFEGFQNYVTCLQTDTYTSTGREKEMENLVIFPNPASGRIRVTTPFSGESFNYMIYSLNGCPVSGGSVVSGQFIDLAACPAGQYLLRLTYPGLNISQSRLFIKK